MAGDGGPATAASLNFPLSAAFGPDGSLYIADAWNDRVRRVDAATGTITTVAGDGPDDATGEECGQGDGGPATSATVCDPSGVGVAANGDVLVSDTRDNRVRRVSAADGTITTIAGNGSPIASGDGGDAHFAGVPHPWGVALDRLGNPIVSDDSYQLRYVNLLSKRAKLFPDGPAPITVEPGTIVTIAGGHGYAIKGTEGDGGPAISAKLDYVKAIGLASDGDILLTEDGAAVLDGKYRFAMRVRRIHWRTGIITTIAGNGRLGAGGEGVPPLDSPLSYPEAAFVYPDGRIGIVDRGNSRLRVIDATGASESTTAGDSIGDGLPAQFAQLDLPFGLAVSGSRVFFGDGVHLRIRGVGADGVISTAVGRGRVCVRFGVAYDGLCGSEGDTGDGGPAKKAHIYDSSGMDATPQGLLAAVVDGRVRVVNESRSELTLFPESAEPLVLAPQQIATAAGGGSESLSAGETPDARSVYLSSPRDVAIASNGDLLIAETAACRIDRVDAATGTISVVAGQPCSNTMPFLDGPIQLARFYAPFGVAAGPDGAIYVADTGNGRIRRIDVAGGTVGTVAGLGIQGFAGDGGPAVEAELAYPASVSFAPDGSYVIADAYNQRVRRVAPDGTIMTVAGSGESSVDKMCGSTTPCGHYAGDGGPATEASLNFPTDAVVTADGRLLIADKENNRIRVVQLELR
jgi:hypothetical protein